MAQPSLPAYLTPGRLETEFPTSTNFQVVFCNDTRNSINITAPDVSGSTITSTAHGFVNGQVVTTNASLGANWAVDATKYVINATANTFQVETTWGGGAIALTGATATIQDLPFAQPIYQNPADSAIINYKYPRTSAAYFVKEIADYDALVTRPQTTRVNAAVLDDANGEAYITLENLTVDNQAGSITIIYDTILLLSGGSTTPGNTSGTLLRVIKNPTTDTIGQAATRELQIKVREDVGIAD